MKFEHILGSTLVIQMYMFPCCPPPYCSYLESCILQSSSNLSKLFTNLIAPEEFKLHIPR